MAGSASTHKEHWTWDFADVDGSRKDHRMHTIAHHPTNTMPLQHTITRPSHFERETTDNPSVDDTGHGSAPGFCLPTGGGGGQMTRAGTHFLARGTALGLPPWGGGGQPQEDTHPQPCAAFPRHSLCAWDFKCSRIVVVRNHHATFACYFHVELSQEQQAQVSTAGTGHSTSNIPIVQGPDAHVPQRGQKKGPTGDLPLPRGGGGVRLKEAPNFFKKAPPSPQSP